MIVMEILEVSVLRLLLTVVCVGLQCVIVVFSGHTLYFLRYRNSSH